MQNRSGLQVNPKPTNPLTQAFTALEATVMLVILFVISMLLIAIVVKKPTAESRSATEFHKAGKSESPVKKTSP